MKAGNGRLLCIGRNFVFHFCPGRRSNLFNLFNRDKWLLMFSRHRDRLVEKISRDGCKSCKSANNTGEMEWNTTCKSGIGAKFDDNLALRTIDIETWDIHSHPFMKFNKILLTNEYKFLSPYDRYKLAKTRELIERFI